MDDERWSVPLPEAALRHDGRPPLRFGGRFLRILGVHDVLSAILADGPEFDALWVSSFGVSAACYGIPDTGVLTATEILETVGRIRRACRLPIIVDTDTGYGGILNIRRMVQDAERAGVSAICIEDAEFPKRNSFLESNGRRLASVRTMVERIYAATASRAGAWPLVIARTEALTQHYPLSEALARAAAYTAAGADAIVVHSTCQDGGEVLEFGRRWERRHPLIAIPTAYSQVSFERLADAGFQGAIMASQLLRAVVRALRTTRDLLATATCAGVADAEISTMADIHGAVRAASDIAFEQEIERAASGEGPLAAAPPPLP